MKYQILEHEGDCDTTVEADDIDGAIQQAKVWLAAGDWVDEESFVDVTITDSEGEETKVELVVGGMPPPACLKGKKHKWESPHEVVGGFEANPGEWSIGGGRFKFVEVCCQCGRYRTKKTESLPDHWPRTPERVTYSEPDEDSLAWVASQ